MVSAYIKSFQTNSDSVKGKDFSIIACLIELWWINHPSLPNIIYSTEVTIFANLNWSFRCKRKARLVLVLISGAF